MSDLILPSSSVLTPVSTPRPKFGQHLVNKGLLTEDMLASALAEQAITHERLGLILVRNGFLTRKNLVANILEIQPDKIYGEQHFTSRVPAELLMSLRAMVVAETDKAVYIGTPTSEKVVIQALTPYYPGQSLNFVRYNHEQLDQYLSDLKSMMVDEDNLVERILRRAMSENTSDVHIIPRYSSYSVFFRQLGVRHLAHEGSLDEYNTLAARIKDLSRMDLAERRIPQDGGFQLDFNGKLVDMRVATLPATNGEYVVIRILDPDRVQPSLSLLGISNVTAWQSGVSRPDGLCLICGPTGSGKTTTLNASVKEMDRFGRSIFTVEDPVEYRIAYTGQVNTNPSLGLDFARAIRAFMRADPDVIVLGEVRDAETARNAVKAAETGHLVLATLHTGSIFGAVQRLRDLEVPQHELRYLLRTILVQRLVRTVCTSCGGKGCPVCFGNGYAGRSTVSECAYFPSDKEVSRMLAGETWWDTMLDDAVNKANQGITSRAEVSRVFGVEADLRFSELDSPTGAQ